MNDVKCLTMKGMMHTIMGQLCDSENEFDVIVKNPVMVLIVPSRGGADTASVTFTPFLNYTNEFGDGIKIHRSDILTINTPVTELLNQYSSAFGSGIVLASSLTQ